jgi:hypothetical protein
MTLHNIIFTVVISFMGIENVGAQKLQIWQASPVWQGTGGACAADFGVLADGFNVELQGLKVEVTFVDKEGNSLGNGVLSLESPIGGSRANRFAFAKLHDVSSNWVGKDDDVPEPLCWEGIQIKINSATAIQGDKSVDFVKTNQIESKEFRKLEIRY